MTGDGAYDEPARDETLAATWRRATEGPDMPDAQWAALAARIGVRAAPILAQRQRAQSWAAHAARWSRVVIPATVAAGIALAFLLHSWSRAGSPLATLPGDEPTMLLAAMAGFSSTHDFVEQFVATAAIEAPVVPISPRGR